MPTYEYECDRCRRVFEIRQRISEPALTTCECGGTVRRLLSAVPFILKGGGWYVTDYPSESRKKAVEAEKGSDTAATADKSEKSQQSTEKSEKSGKSDKPEKSDKPDRSEKSEKSDTSEKSEKSDTSEKSAPAASGSSPTSPAPASSTKSGSD